LCKGSDNARFFFVSSTEVYGHKNNSTEADLPAPASINGESLLISEKYCKMYQQDYGINVMILRLTNIYGPDEKSGLLYKIINRGNKNGEIVLSGSANTPLSFLHTNDVVDFIKRAVDEEYYPESLVVNLSSSKPITLSGFIKILEKYYSVIELDDREILYTKPAQVSVARKIFDWYDVHDVVSDINEIVDLSYKTPAQQVTIFQSIIKKVSNYSNFIKWFELVSGALIAIYLSQITGTLIQFQYIDYRLVYVVIMGSIYGLQFGLLASLLMSGFVLITWLNLGVDWQLLIYNVGNWFPFVLYFVTGLITGYNHDKTENAILYERKQNEVIMDKYTFLYEVFNEVRQLKDEFRERLIGYRDSFGKIFAITRELDELQEHAVYLKALSILEELMNNKSIAIYSLDGNRTYARLEVSSSEINKSLKKSLKLEDLPDVLESIEQGKIFQNVRLLENYPAYIAPVLANAYPFNVPVALIIIWSADFNQYSLYYYNLFKVISGMIQASLVRATSFLDANYEKIYLPATRILNHDAFIEILRVRLEMRKNKVSEFQMVSLQDVKYDINELYDKVSESIRTVDIVGLLRNNCYYILLSQATTQDAVNVIERLNKLEVAAEMIDANEILSGQFGI
jgi:UDP-glucose 4-epimerase